MAIGVDGYIETPAFISRLADIRKELHNIARDDNQLLTAETVNTLFFRIKQIAEDHARSQRIRQNELRSDVHATQAYLRDTVLGLTALGRCDAPSIAIKTALCAIDV